MSIAPSTSLSSHGTTNFSTSNSSTADEEAQQRRILESSIFPLFSEMSKYATIPKYFHYLQILITFIQAIISSFWVSSKISWPNPPKLFVVLFGFCSFGCTLEEPSSVIAVSVFGIVVMFISVCITIPCIVTYKTKHSFHKWELYVIRVLLTIILPILVPVYCSCFGCNLAALVKESTISNIVFSLIYLILAILICIIYYYSNGFTVCSPILIRHGFGAWDHDIFPLIIFQTSGLCFSGYLADYFPRWISIVAIFLSLFTTYLAIRKLFFFPFFRLAPVIITLFVLCCIIGGLVITFVSLFGKLFWPIRIFVPFAIGAVIAAVISFFIHRKYHSIKEKLMISALGDVQQVSDNEKNEYFEKMVFSSINDALRYMRVGIAERCDFFLDFSFLRYLVMNYAEKPILQSIAQFYAFFPSELQMLTSLIATISTFRDTKLIEQFLLYQINKIHITRQSSVSSDARYHINSLKNKSQKVIATVRCFWSAIQGSTQSISMETLNFVRQESLSTESSFIDSTEKFPNNSALCEEYSNFLIEAMGNYSRALHWKNMAASAEIGKKSSKDYCYMSMVNVYPEYLFYHITDSRGSFIQKANGLGASSNTLSMSSLSLSSSTSSSLDENFEIKNEELLTNFIRDGHLRIALQSALNKSTLPTISAMRTFMLTSFLVYVAAYIVIFVTIPLIADSSMLNVIENSNFAAASTSYSTMTTGGAIVVATRGTEKDKASTIKYHAEEVMKHHTNAFDALPEDGIIRNTILWTHRQTLLCTDMITEVLKSIVSSGSARRETVDAYANGHALLWGFDGDNKVININMSVKGALAGVINNVKYGISAILPGEDDHETMFALLKSAIGNGVSLTPYIFNVEQMLAIDGVNSVKAQRLIIYILSYGLSGILLVIFGVYAAVVIKIYFTDMRHVTVILRSVKEEAVEESRRPIRMNAEDKNVDVGGSINWHMQDNFKIITVLLIIALVVVASVLVLFSTNIFKELDAFEKIFSYYSSSARRHSSVYHFITTLIARALGEEMEMTTEQCYNLLQRDVNEVIKAHSTLMTDAIAYDQKLDEMQLTADCTEEAAKNSMRLISCSSVDRKMMLILRLMDQILEKFHENNKTRAGFNAYKFNLDDAEFSKILFILDTGLDDQLLSFNSIMIQKARSMTGDMKNQCNMMAGIGIAFAIVTVVLLMSIVAHLQTSFEGMKQLIAILPPKRIVVNKLLMDFILGQNAHSDDEIMSFSEMIINSSKNIVVSCSANLTIEAVNPALKEISGFSNDTILRQPLQTLIPLDHDGTETTNTQTMSMTSNDNAQEFYNEIEAMRDDSEAQTVSHNVLMITDSGVAIPVTATVVAVRDNHTNEIASLLITLYNRTSELEEKEKVKAAQKRSAKLLKGLLPQPAYQVVKKGSGDGLFFSDISVVIFIHINGFADMVSVLQPSAVMDMLCSIYEKFDDIRRKYPAIERLKINDELLLCCAGLFNYKDDHEQQCIQSVLFCADLLSEINVINDSNNVNLGLSVALNMGGPLCGCVVDMKTPSFDILGSVIGEALRMIECGAENTIQVSQNMMQFLSEDKFDITPGVVMVDSSKKKTQLYNVKSKIAGYGSKPQTPGTARSGRSSLATIQLNQPSALSHENELPAITDEEQGQQPEQQIKKK